MWHAIFSDHPGAVQPIKDNRGVVSLLSRYIGCSSDLNIEMVLVNKQWQVTLNMCIVIFAIWSLQSLNHSTIYALGAPQVPRKLCMTVWRDMYTVRAVCRNFAMGGEFGV